MYRKYIYYVNVWAKLIRSHFNGWIVFKFHAVLVWAGLLRQVALILDFAANARRMSNTKNVYPPAGVFPLPTLSPLFSKHTRTSNAIYMPSSLACLSWQRLLRFPHPLHPAPVCMPCIFLHFWLLSVHLARLRASVSADPPLSALLQPPAPRKTPLVLYALFVLRDIDSLAYASRIFASTLPQAFW